MASAATRSQFIEMMAPIAQRQAKKHDNAIFPSVCIAMAIHESGWGTSAKMVKANALFGFKVMSGRKYGTAWKGKAYKTGTTEYYDGKTATKITDWFRAYDSVEDATEDYMDLLCTLPRYKNALHRNTPQECIDGICAGGYASGPDYAKAIKQLISTYNLEKYDGKELPEKCPFKFTVKTCRRGSGGQSVGFVQWHLCKHGYKVAIDLIFGAKTELAVVLFQKDHGLKPDGVVGIQTYNALIKY